MKELYDMEKENIDFELIAKNKKILPKKLNNINIDIIEGIDNNSIELEREIIKPKFGIYNSKFSIDHLEKDLFNNRENIPIQPRILNNNLQNHRININKNIVHSHSSNNQNEELDRTIKKYNENLEKLKFEDFMSRKQMQDDLLDKINSQMEKLKFGLNDKNYEEKLANDWVEERRKKIEQISKEKNENEILNYNNYNNYNRHQINSSHIKNSIFNEN
jgi:hypothetical protein